MSTSFGRAIRTLFVSLLYVSVYLIMQNAVAMVFGMVGMRMAVDAGADPLWGFDYSISSNVYACTVIAMFASFGLYAVMGLLRERPLKGEIRLHRSGEMLVLPAVIVAIGCRLAVAIYTVLSENVPALTESVENAPNYSESLTTPLGVLIALLSTVLLAPIFEEILFRGLIQSELMRGFPPFLAVVVSSLIFGAAHGMLFQSVFAFFVGLIFGWCFYVSGNLIPGIVAHMVFNASAYITVYFISGDRTVLIVSGLLAVAMLVFGCAWLYRSSRTPDNHRMM